MKRIRFPHPLTLLVACIAVAAALSYVLPSGEYNRVSDPATGRQVVVAGTFHRVPQSPVGFFQALVDVPRGMADAASVIFLVFLAGGAFTVVDRTGVLQAGVDSLARPLPSKSWSTSFIATAKLMFWPSVTDRSTTPTARPWSSINGPPEFPSLTAADVWI